MSLEPENASCTGLPGFVLAIMPAFTGCEKMTVLPRPWSLPAGFVPAEQEATAARWLPM